MENFSSSSSPLNTGWMENKEHRC
uniref:Uncharacterized protein n=1 Tax=Oryza glumipatula TaxID=40148 RepID=A0A0D9YA38_9ORYZ